MSETIDLSIVMPCLNEEETLERCIQKAFAGMDAAGVSGEVLIADNGSTDASIEIATKAGARVVPVRDKGYGNALRGGFAAARGRWIIMGDADDSYDFSRIGAFVEKLREGYDLVMGCRMPRGGGTVLPGAMPWKNRWIGNPVLSFIGRTFYNTPVHDFHCGMRGFSRAAYEQLDLQTTGMEFASEMVMKATLKKVRVAEVPITLHPDGRSRPPHLKPWRDGWRHLRFMLIYSPRWLFLVPGTFLFSLGIVAAAVLGLSALRVGGVALDIGTLATACMCTIVGVQLISFAFFTKVFGITAGLLPDSPAFSRIFRFFSLEKGLALGLAILVLGLVLFLRAWWIWSEAGFGAISYPENLRRIIPASTCVVVGIQIVFSSFFMSVLGLKTATLRPPGTTA